MRPLELTFQAFGSYPGKESVDFRALSQRGLFVVAGPTGAGKTSVFDAMVYALFGVLPGARSSEGRERSDFAEPTTETFVEFEFQVQGGRYRVRRTPAQLRPKHRGGGFTTQQTQATLVRCIDDATEGGKSGAKQVSIACEDLIGLGADEFQKVVLLPQGEFTKFLIAKDKDREDLLRELFSGSLYADATEWLARKMKALEKQVAAVDEKIRHHRSSADAAFMKAQAVWASREGVETVDDDTVATMSSSELGLAVQKLALVRKAAAAEADAAQGRLTAAAAALARAQGAAARHDRARVLQARLETLAARKEEVWTAAKAAECSAAARPVEKGRLKVAAAERVLNLAVVAREEMKATIEEGFTALGELIPAIDAAVVAAALSDMKARVGAQAQQLRAHRSAKEKTERLALVAKAAEQKSEDAASAVALGESALQKLKESLVPLDTVAALLAERTTAWTEAKENHEQRVELASGEVGLREIVVADDRDREAYEQTVRRFVASQAPLLAARLEDSQPCMVCGSVEHPSPARTDDGAVVDHDAVDVAQGHWTKQQTQRQVVEREIGRLRSKLGDAARLSVEETAEIMRTAHSELAASKAAVSKVAELRKGIDVDESALDKLRVARTEAATVAGSARGAAETARAEAERLADVVVGIDAEMMTRQEGLVSELLKSTASLGDLLNSVTRAEAELTASHAALTETIASSGFADVDATVAKVLDREEEERRIKALKEWSSAHDNARMELGLLEQQGIPEERPNVDALETAERDARTRATTSQSTATTGADALDRAKENLEAAAEVAASSSDLRQRCDSARTVFKVCNGESGRLKVKLERWVLANELDRVTAQANLHLERMTGYRYRLQRVKEGGRGLTLEVTDSHTGRSRGTATLSGGEQFQASLSLALGLADVISHGGTASGKQFEALFVDEGFGSLDPDALDEAIGALSQIQASGRIVGAITHVEGMKERLHVGIEVRRCANGRGSTLVVHP